MKRKRKAASALLSLALAAAMVLSAAPVNVKAAEIWDGDTTTENGKGYDASIQNTYEPGDGTVYYVDSKGGADTNSGTSEDQAFKTLGKVNEIQLEPGDSILLKRGSIFDDQQLAPKGRGTAEEHILLGAYGEGNMPVINTNFEYREAILIENMEYVDITGIEVTNDDNFNDTSLASDPKNNKNTCAGGKANFRPLGVHIIINEQATDTLKPGTEGDDRIYRGINLDGCYIHDVDGDENWNTNKLSGGIGIEIKYWDNGGRLPVFDGITLQNNRIDQVDRCGIKGVRLTELNHGEETGGDVKRRAGVRRAEKNQATTNYVVRNNYLTDVGGDGILVDSTRGAIIENNLLYNHTIRATGANAGIWSWNAFDTVFQYNESYGGPSYNQDGCSYDSDYNSAGTIFQYNYSHDCVMGFMLIMGGNDTDIIRYNLSQNDGNVWRHIAGNSNSPSYIYNNVFYYNGDNWRFVNNNAADTSQTQSIRNNWQYFNNIFYNTSKTTTSNWKIGDWEKAVVSNNMVYEASGNYADNEIPNAIHADPDFVNPGGGASRSGEDIEEPSNIWSSLDAYQLNAGSPAIGAGTYVDVQPQATGDNTGNWDSESDRNANVDFYGNKLYTGAPDIGLEESDKQGGDFEVEKNAIYRIMAPNGHKYLTMTQGETGVTAAEKADENQAFTVVGSGDKYKFRIWDDAVSAYRYLAVVDGNLQLSEDEQTVWEIEDQKNGLFVLKADGKKLAYENGELVLKDTNFLVELFSDAEESEQWYLALEEHSHSYNVGGEEIEGFSADQAYDEETEQSGAYIEETEKFTTDASEEVYQTGVKGQEIGYKLYASNGEYTLRLYFAEPEDVENLRTMDILVNGSTVSEAYVLDKETKELTLTGIYPANGMIDVKIQAAYNTAGKKADAVLCGISAEKQIRKEIVSRINAGGGADDGLIADAAYTTANGAGYYNGDEESTVISGGTGIVPDAGVGTAMKTAREGSEFGYKVKAMPGTYRVKLYFAELNDTEHKFDIAINGDTVQSGYSVKETAGATNKAVGLVYETESKDGFIDVKFTGVDGSKAMVNAVIVEAYDKPDGDKLTIQTATGASQQNDKTSAMCIDGNHATRWASVASDTNGQAITFDLGTSHILNGIVLDWTPNAMAKDYHIDISDDGAEWDTAVTVTDAKQGLNVHNFDSAVGRYVRVVCDQKLNEWAISLTEAEIYGGAAVEGDAAATVSAVDEADGVVKVTAGMGYIYKRYSTATVEFQYDPSEAEFTEDGYTVEDTDKLDQVTEPEIDEENGIVTQRFGLKQWNGFQAADNAMLSAKFKNLTDSMTEVEVTVSLTSSDGHVTELPSVKAYLPAQADAELMNALLAEARELAATAVVGSDRGEYPQESVDALNAAIAAAEGTDTSDAAAVNSAAVQLYEALELMEETCIKNTKTMYHKDFNDPNETAPTVSAGTGSVSDGRWNLSLAGSQEGIITDATPLDKGYYYIKLKVNTAENQTWFSIYGEDNATRRFETGYEPNHWFINRSTNGWAEWGTAPNMVANTDIEVMLKFDSSQEGVTPATLWINGQKIGDNTEKIYNAGTGRPTLGTRNVAKTFSVEEIYFTDAEPVTLTVSSTGDGTVSQTGSVTSFVEADKTFYFYPEDGKQVEKVLVDGQEVEWNTKDNSYTFEYLQENHTLEVQFSGEAVVEPQVTYHQDYMLDTEADFAGDRTSAEVSDQALNITAEGWGDKSHDSSPAIAVDQNAPEITSGTFFTRFSVNSSDIADGIGQDQVLFDIKTSGSGMIRIGFDYLGEGSEVGNWFYDKALSGAGWGNFSNGAGVAALTEDEDHTLQLDFTKTAENTYNLHLIVDGVDMGTVDNVSYDDAAGSYGFGARRTTKNYTVKEVYYTNNAKHNIEVTAGEGGTVSQTGDVTVFAGSNKTLFVTPNEGYVVDTVTVDGTAASLTGGQYTFMDIAGDHTFAVTFKEASAVVVDKSELQKAYDTYKDMTNTGYTEESWKVFADARDAAKAVLDDPNADQAAVDAAKTALEKAFADLKTEPEPPTVDKAELQKLYDEYSAIEKGDYTDDSWNAFQAALTAAKTVLDDEDATQEEVNTAYAALEAAKDALEKIDVPEPADKDALQKLYDEYSAIEKGNYTDDSWNAFQAALTAAKDVLDDKDAAQAEVDAAEAALTAAKAALEEIQTPEPADKDALLKLFNENQNKTEANYTAESWAVFKAALDQAYAVLSDDEATQEAVDEAYADLEAAVAQLAKNPEPGTDPDKPSGGDDQQGGDNQQTGGDKKPGTGTSGTDSDKAVQTGDNTTLPLMAGMCMLMFAAAAAVVIIRKKTR